MNLAIVGDGPEEQAWAAYLASHSEHRLSASCPGLEVVAAAEPASDLDDLLARNDLDAVIIGGPTSLRAEALRRVAAAGWPALVLHPPGPNADPYYHVALSHRETGAVVVPDLSARRHPGVELIEVAHAKEQFGAFRELRYEVTVPAGTTDLVLAGFARAVDVVRAILGEIEAVTAIGDPPGCHPTLSLVVQLRSAGGYRGEVRIRPASGQFDDRAVLVLAGTEGTMTLVQDAGLLGPSRLVTASPTQEETHVTELSPYDARSKLLSVLSQAIEGRPFSPDLLDGTRAMELTEAVERSLHRGRTVDLAYEEVSELGSFKSIMTGLGCGLLMATLMVLPIALAGPALGFPWLIYLAWAVPPLLVVFILLQFLRFGLQTPGPKASERTSTTPRSQSGVTE